MRGFSNEAEERKRSLVLLVDGIAPAKY